MDKIVMDESSSDDGGITKTKQVKAVVLGDGGVGKTCLCERFCKDFFASTYKQTLGLDFFSQTVQLPGNLEVTFNLFDIGGHSLTSSLLPTYVKGADCLIYVFDLTDNDSLLNISEWHQHCKNTKCSHIVLVGNKSDLAGRRAVCQAQIDKIHQEIDAHSQFAVSALTGDRVQMLFTSIAGALTGVDVKQLMLDTRNVVNAEISRQDMATAVSMNRDGTIAADIEEPIVKTNVALFNGTGSFRSQIGDKLSGFEDEEKYKQQQYQINQYEQARSIQFQQEEQPEVTTIKSVKKRKSGCRAL